jgi:ATP-dependent DNA helicase RecG
LVITDDAVNDVVNDALNDAVSIQVRDRLAEELKWIQQHGGIALKALIEAFQIKRATGQRDIKQLKDAGLIIFTGSDKSGKYILTEKGKELFK